MLSGILSDTLILNSPTTTRIDKDAVNNLAKIAKVDYKKYGFELKEEVKVTNTDLTLYAMLRTAKKVKEAN